jgi:hypothetical protein
MLNKSTRKHFEMAEDFFTSLIRQNTGLSRYKNKYYEQITRRLVTHYNSFL